MASTHSRVLVIGGGIAGCVAACLLKQKGYEPIIFEKASRQGDVGASMLICPNGSKVLRKMGGGVVEKLRETAPGIVELCDHTAAGEILGEVSPVPADWGRRYGYPAIGVKRTLFAKWVLDAAIDQGIEVRAGWALERIEQDDTSVTAFFNDGRSEKGEFLVGCDGLKSKTRRWLLASKGLEDGQPSFTGLAQISGISPTPVQWLDRPGLRNWYGASLHLVCYPITMEHSSWGLTRNDSTAEEASWGLFDQERRDRTRVELEETLRDLSWDPVVAQMVGKAQRLIKYGIYDRPELKPSDWYLDRCVLMGDAVHPTAVHLGQGANQALEDCFYLTAELPDCDPAAGIPTEKLTQAFGKYAEMRQPRTSALVEAARRQGELRVSPPEKCAERNALIAKLMTDRAGLEATFDSRFAMPI
ncbi:hypothetical protein PpBr36_04731 [Pyricularia pennisetigena]|uniref:hypothetical protein n=1 Tax=Pyricularia pennisetigena TaxID=1578925 RepID=UPI00114F52F7|nr:hypothetical protein PpBr36_04731 [Pyricularia pennisetigena]TLS27021.1 hypothetical protein PpBr36_04731 [Pyricularia pennisetigena]